MSTATNADSIWRLNGTTARISCGALAGEIDVARPSVGLHQSNLDHGRVPCAIFPTMRRPELHNSDTVRQSAGEMLWPLPLAEAYVRGNDLVATYSPAAEWPYSPQLYWQARTLQLIDGVLGSVSMLVSVQTHLLDTHPKIDVVSQIPSSEYCCIALADNEEAIVEPVSGDKTIKSPTGMYCVLWRLRAKPMSYIEIASAADLYQISFGPGGEGRLFATWQLLTEFLEKGVIRRARVHAALLPRENDIELAIECCRAVERIPLPLTT